mgnify:CR=1 FL=1
MDFKKTVLYIAIVLLIVALIFLGTMMASQSKTATWPPRVSGCPDFWEEKTATDQNGAEYTECYNLHNLGSSSCDKKKNFSADFWKGTEGDCRKKTWSKNCDLTWDGITNNYNICNEDLE